MTPSLDLFGTTDRLVEDAKTRCREARREPGGGGINVARNLHVLGDAVLAVYAADGVNGQQIEDRLRDESVPCQRIPVARETRQNLALTETATGRMFHFVFPGTELEDTEWQACLAAVSKAESGSGWLVLSGSLPPGVPLDFYARVTRSARAKSTRVVLDTSGAALEPALNEGVFLAKLNRKELTQLGYSGDWQPESQLAFMAGLVQGGVAEWLVVTQGEQGALMVTRDGLKLRAVPPQVDVVSHVGAGDGFVSLMVHSLSRNASPEEALEYGVAGAAAVIGTPGNRLSHRVCVESILARMKR